MSENETEPAANTAAGGCACGAVRFEVAGSLRPVVACHCETCRRTSGHYWAATQAYEADLRLLEDQDLEWYRSSGFPRRGFCRRCGSSLFYRLDGGDRISIAAGALEAPTGLRLAGHIFTAEAGDYYGIEDGLPRYPARSVGEAWGLPPRDG